MLVVARVCVFVFVLCWGTSKGVELRALKNGWRFRTRRQEQEGSTQPDFTAAATDAVSTPPPPSSSLRGRRALPPHSHTHNTHTTHPRKRLIISLQRCLGTRSAGSLTTSLNASRSRTILAGTPAATGAPPDDDMAADARRRKPYQQGARCARSIQGVRSKPS